MMKTLLLACYELGHQPLSLAWPAAVLGEAGLDVVAADLSVEEFPTEDAVTADLVAIAAPMHTALRLGVDAARRVRALNPQAHVCFFGLYAWLNADYLLHSHNGDGPPLADSVIAGEPEPVLAALALALARGESPDRVAGVTTRTHAAPPHLARVRFPPPVRDGLPGLARYARYLEDGVAHLAGYTEASRGCLHTCRHCPVVPVYRGRFFVVPVETVLADIAQQVEAGARHITFGDPDFLNGPGHARKVARALHAAFPQISFDFTTKVEHILEHPDLVAELAELGATFVISAFESVSDHVLARLDKGHTAADMEAALAVVRRAGLAIQPTWVPFTPWTTLNDYLAMLAWIRRHGLIPATPPVQLSIRLLIPPGSALLDGPDVDAWLGPLEAENFTYVWRHPDPRMDTLQQQAAAIAEAAGEDGDPQEGFRAVEEAAWSLAGLPLPPAEPVSGVAPPRLTEHWFC